MNEDTAHLEVESARGDRYKAVYEEIFEPFRSGLEDQLIEAFKNETDSEIFVNINLSLRILDKLDTHLQNFIQTGNLAKIQLGDK